MRTSKIFIVVFCIMLRGVHLTSLSAQVIHEVKSKHEADIILYKVPYPSQADIRVFTTPYENRADPERGLWHITPYKARADWKVYWTPYRKDADCTVYMTTYPSQATKNRCYLEWQKRNDQRKRKEK